MLACSEAAFKAGGANPVSIPGRSTSWRPAQVAASLPLDGGGRLRGGVDGDAGDAIERQERASDLARAVLAEPGGTRGHGALAVHRAHDDELATPPVEADRNEDGGALPDVAHQTETLERLHHDGVELAQQVEAGPRHGRGLEARRARPQARQLVQAAVEPFHPLRETGGDLRQPFPARERADQEDRVLVR